MENKYTWNKNLPEKVTQTTFSTEYFPSEMHHESASVVYKSGEASRVMFYK